MIRLCCAFGGRSTEYEVSLESAYGVLSNADNSKYEIIKLGITRDGKWYFYGGDNEKIRDGSWVSDRENLRKCRLSLDYGDRALYTDDGRYEIDVFFPVMHGANCEDGTLQGALALSGIPFVGSPCASSAVCMDKAFTKQLISLIGVPQADAITVRKSEIVNGRDEIINRSEKKFGYPVFVKPSRAGSSVGVVKVKKRSDFPAAFDTACGVDDKILIERYIPGGEFEVAVLGNEEGEASCVGEIVPGSEFYDYNNKYSDDTALYYIPARLDNSLADKIRGYAVDIYKALDCKGLARVDFFSDGKTAVFNEINTLPGFTPISMYPKLWGKCGLSYSALIDRLVDLALNEGAKK